MTAPARQLFAVIPAAGLSRRMGQHKLLLPLGDKTILHRLLETLSNIKGLQTIVVIRPDDDALKQEAEKTSAIVVQPSVAPQEMRESVTVAIDFITKRFSPIETDSWMLIPADHPVLESSLLEKFIDQWNQCDAPVMIPTYKKKRGHPTFFRWSLAKEIHTIPNDKGLNSLVAQYANAIKEIPTNHSAVITDIDNPEDYATLLAMHQE